MNLTFLRRSLLALLLTGCAALLRAAEPATPPAPAAAPAPTTPPATPAAPAAVTPIPDAEVLALPKVQVTSQRIKAIDNELKKIDKQIAREKKKVKSTELDRALNNDKVATAAAVLGGNSASHLSAVAATRVSLLETERMLLERMKFPRTLEDFALIEKELEQIRTTRRNLDNVQR